MLRVSDAFEQALKESRSVNWRASLLDKKGEPLPTDLKIQSWTLNEDLESVPAGILTLDVVDEAYLLDVESTAARARWLSRFISLDWGIYVDDGYEYVSIFEGPITAARREGAAVTFTATTKDGQGVDPYFFKRSFSVRKHTRISKVLQAIADERGDRKVDIPNVNRRLDRDRTWAPGQEPWRVMQQITRDLDDFQLYYRGNGVLHLRRTPDQPAWRFTHDGNKTIVIGHPENRFDIEPLFNSWMVRGERHYKKPVDIAMELDEKAETGDTSIHVDKAPDEVADGQKIVIGKGDKQETRTISGSYTSGSRTIPLVRALDHNHKIGAAAVVTVSKDKVRAVIGRADLGQNHPFSPESLTDGKRPRIKIEDRPGIHAKDTADARAERQVRKMSAGIESELGLLALVVPHLELGDLTVVETEGGGRHNVRIKNREMSSNGRMVINRRRKQVPKKRRRRQRGPKARVKRVRREIRGGVTAQGLTGTWSDGSSLSLEAVTDFSAAGGSVVFEPDTPREELAHYTTIDEASDQLIGVTRPDAQVHRIGTFVQAGEDPTVEKLVDGYIDDETIAAVGIPVPPTKYGYLSTRTVEADEKVIQLDVDDQGELSVLEGPAGEPPVFDEDLELLPPVGGGDASESEEDPGTGQVQPPPGMGFEDREPPSGSVTPVVTGMLGNTLAIRIPTISNSSIVTYKIHAHTTLGFTPAANTLVGTIQLAGTPGFTGSFFIRDFPSGHVLDGAASDPPQPGTVYEIAVVPSDGSGDAPGPYPRATGTPIKIATVQIDNLAITAALLAANAVTSTKIADDAVTTPKLVAGAVTTAKITAGAITADKIEANAVTADKIAANAVTSDKIAANTIVAGDIAASTITATQIAGSTITADKLSVSTLSAITANLGTVTAGTITGLTISGGIITGAVIKSPAASGSRIELGAVGRQNEMVFYDSSGEAGSISMPGFQNLKITSPVQVFLGEDTFVDGTLTALGYVAAARLWAGTNANAPDTGYVSIYKDGADLKAKDPSGVVRTLCTF